MNFSLRLLTGTSSCVARCRNVASRSYIHHQLLARCRGSAISGGIYHNHHQASFKRCMNTLSITNRNNVYSGSNSLLWKRVSALMKPVDLHHRQRRTITVVSRLGKRKTCKAVLKRFRRVQGGYLKRWRSGMVKKQRKKSSWRKFRLRGSILVKRSSHLRTLNKMMYKY